MTKKSATPVISTGRDEIDKRIGGGIPLNSLTLIEGESHSGKSVFTQQLVWGTARDGFRVSMFTSENTVRSLVAQMNSLNLEINPYLLLGDLRVFPFEVARTKAEALDNLLEAISNEVRREQEIIFVDSLTPYIMGDEVQNAARYFEQCKKLNAKGTSIVTVIHSHAVDREFLIRVQSICDAHLHFRTEADGSRLIKLIEVAKIRGASRNTGNIISFEIEPGIGLRIIPISKAQG